VKRLMLLILALCAACTDPQPAISEACEKWLSLPFPAEVVDRDGTRYTAAQMADVCGAWKGK